MDTRFWGSSGWRLLHLITFDYTQSEENAKIYASFFETLPYILPCKFCRASLTDYYKDRPFKDDANGIKKDLDLKKWMYNIHNCVNDKLREQGLNPSPNPKYKDVKEFYKKWQKCNWQQHLSTFWNFLFAIAYNHPKEAFNSSTPIQNCPEYVYTCNDKCEKNKWNILSLDERILWFRRFWLLLPAVLPGVIGEKWRNIEKNNPPKLECRRSILAWLWRMRCSLDYNFKDPYTSICKKIASYSSDCNKNRKAITCRRNRKINVTYKNYK